MNINSDDYFDDEDIVSKTQRKKEAHAQQELGERLTQLPNHVLEGLPLSEVLRTAIAEFKRLPPKRGAIKRQLQFIGKLMRDCDAEAIAAQLDAALAVSKATEKNKEIALQYCKLILEHGDDGIQQVLSELPALDRQQVRQYLRNVQAAKEETKKANAERRLLDYLIAACHT